ncbi:phenazine biosynthesis protein PhzF [Methylococcaceae bacterium HT4]|nr:PhzF family phenazine biosynthesis protein [Methyloprofundus sp.]TXK96958.1 phenazine biosynthesis protein PhzF [Methylococcaceae bacterium CS4]TXK98324.1 phenazine biosynthesis protein PhzF [Methylococcaceae bacterium CS5]TXL04266.1 phenazine biosynthesis protein PhzF [Methylococcaceae bacterium CS3]TXL05967.1 phenazine biosynthesis protein PhzF [Methylococcaceae bacterium CS1]TXL10531.1 phenazine biosynthesis protein PhzF [Methylococcaceae bacterium CS2]TXL13051.1 phenazine biosynthesis 
MNYTYYIADAFTKKAFNGAQVAVFPEAEGLNAQQMTLVARELNLSETVFLSKIGKSGNRFQMKLFSPLGEVDFASQAIISAAFALAANGRLKLNNTHTPVVFQLNSGDVEANVSSTDGKPDFVQFTRTVSPVVDYFAPSEAELASFLGIDAAYIDNNKYATRLVSCGVPYLIVPTFYYETLREAKFDFAAWSQSIAPQTAAQEFLLVSPKTPAQNTDFAVRLLGPNIGAHEDPPVGSAIPALAAYLCSFDHLQKGTYTFAVERGDEAKRRSVLNLEMDHKGEDTLTLRVGGEAVKVSEGTMFIPEA